MSKHQSTAPDVEIRTFKATELRLIDGADGKPPKLTGYAAVFNSPSEDLGGFTEYVMPGAFTRTLAEGADVRLMINHEGLPLARSSSGTLKVAEDDKGLRFEADLDPDDPDVQRLRPKMKRGDVKECSFAFVTKTDNWRIQDGKSVRELLDVDLSDVSVVTYPAYPATSAALRSMQQWRQKGGGGSATENRDGHMSHDGPVALHGAGIRCARDLIAAGKIGTRDDDCGAWDWDDEDQERSADQGGKFHLATRTDTHPDDEDHHVYPFGKRDMVHMDALRAVCREAGKNGADNVQRVARDLLDAAKRKLDEKKAAAASAEADKGKDADQDAMRLAELQLAESE